MHKTQSSIAMDGSARTGCGLGRSNSCWVCFYIFFASVCACGDNKFPAAATGTKSRVCCGARTVFVVSSSLTLAKSWRQVQDLAGQL